MWDLLLSLDMVHYFPLFQKDKLTDAVFSHPHLRPIVTTKLNKLKWDPESDREIFMAAFQDYFPTAGAGAGVGDAAIAGGSGGASCSGSAGGGVGAGAGIDGPSMSATGGRAAGAAGARGLSVGHSGSGNSGNIYLEFGGRRTEEEEMMDPDGVFDEYRLFYPFSPRIKKIVCDFVHGDRKIQMDVPLKKQLMQSEAPMTRVYLFLSKHDDLKHFPIYQSTSLQFPLLNVGERIRLESDNRKAIRQHVSSMISNRMGYKKKRSNNCLSPSQCINLYSRLSASVRLLT